MPLRIASLIFFARGGVELRGDGTFVKMLV